MDKGKGKGKGKSKQPKGKSKEPEPPWAYNPSTTPSGAASSATPTNAPLLAQDENVIQLIKELRKSEANLSAEAQALLNASELKSSQQLTKVLHSAVAKFGQCKKKLQEAREARLTLHSAWRSYLHTACQTWQKYMEEFNQQDASLEENITEAEENLTMAKANLDDVKKQAAEPADAENEAEDDLDKAPMAVDSIKEGIAEMAQSLMRIKSKADESLEAQQQYNKKFKSAFGSLPGGGPTASMAPFGGAGKGSQTTVAAGQNGPPPTPGA